MSDHGDEDREDTGKRLDEEFPGSTEVRGTTRERIKTGITGAAVAQGFKTRGLTGTPWSQSVSVTLQESVYVSMTSGGVGHGIILQLLAPVYMGDTGNSPSQTSSSDVVRLVRCLTVLSASVCRGRTGRIKKRRRKRWRLAYRDRGCLSRLPRKHRRSKNNST